MDTQFDVLRNLPENWQLFLPAAAFAAVSLLALLLIWLSTATARHQVDVLTLPDSVPDPWLARIIPDLTTGRASGLDRDLIRAGLYQRRARAEFLMTCNLLVLSAIAFTVWWMWAASDSGPTEVLRAMLIGIFIVGWTYVTPRLLLQWQGARRIRNILAALPDVLDVLTMCIAGGLSLSAALQRTAQQLNTVHPELARELDIVRRQMTTGSVEQAMQQFAARIDEPDLSALSEMIVQAERIGSDVAGVIREYSDNIRRTHRQQLEARGNRMSVQLLFPVMFCLTPAAYIVLVTPSIVEMRQFLIRENEPGGALDTTNSRARVSNPTPSTNRTQR